MLVEKLTIDELLDKYSDKDTGIFNVPDDVVIELLADNDNDDDF